MELGLVVRLSFVARFFRGVWVLVLVWVRVRGRERTLTLFVRSEAPLRNARGEQPHPKILIQRNRHVARAFFVDKEVPVAAILLRIIRVGAPVAIVRNNFPPRLFHQRADARVTARKPPRAVLRSPVQNGLF